MTSCLKRYWFEFDFSDDGLTRFGYLTPTGCGITAYDYANALRIMRVFILRGNSLPRFSRIIENVDVSTIEDMNVVPNLGVPVWRGVWYPSYNLWQGAYTDR